MGVKLLEKLSVVEKKRINAAALSFIFRTMRFNMTQPPRADLLSRLRPANKCPSGDGPTADRTLKRLPLITGIFLLGTRERHSPSTLQGSAKSGLLHRSKQHHYSITSSARANSDDDTARWSILAVWAFITNSNLSTCRLACPRVSNPSGYDRRTCLSDDMHR